MMKQRAWQELAEDARFPYMVGRLVGAAEGAAALLAGGTVSEQDQRAMAARLEAAASWFLEHALEGKT
jgi:hypothetical protein